MAWARNLDDPRNSCGWARQLGPAAAAAEPAGPSRMALSPPIPGALCCANVQGDICLATEDMRQACGTGVLLGNHDWHRRGADLLQPWCSMPSLCLPVPVILVSAMLPAHARDHLCTDQWYKKEWPRHFGVLQVLMMHKLPRPQHNSSSNSSRQPSMQPLSSQAHCRTRSMPAAAQQGFFLPSPGLSCYQTNSFRQRSPLSRQQLILGQPSARLQWQRMNSASGQPASWTSASLLLSGTAWTLSCRTECFEHCAAFCHQARLFARMVLDFFQH